MEGDLLAALVDALAAGVVAGTKDTAAGAVKSAYERATAVLASRRVNVSAIERGAASPAERKAIAESLAEHTPQIGDDRALFSVVEELLEAIAVHDAGAGRAVGVDLDRLRAEFVRLRGIESDGVGVRVRDADIAGGIDIEDVRARTPRDEGSKGASDVGPSPR